MMTCMVKNHLINDPLTEFLPWATINDASLAYYFYNIIILWSNLKYPINVLYIKLNTNEPNIIPIQIPISFISIGWKSNEFWICLLVKANIKARQKLTTTSNVNK
jgi:hypothetical protein